MLSPRPFHPGPVWFTLLYFQNSEHFLKKENANSAGDILPLRHQVRTTNQKQHTFLRISVYTVTCITLEATYLCHKSLIRTYKGLHLKWWYDGGPILLNRNSFPPYKEIQCFLIWCCLSLFGESQSRSLIGCQFSELHSHWSMRTAHWNKYQNGCARDNVTVDMLKHKNNKTSTFFPPLLNSQRADPHHTFSHSFHANFLKTFWGQSVTVRRMVRKEYLKSQTN